MTWKEWASKAVQFPELIQFEFTNQCNARCIMCPVNRGMKRKKEDLPRHLFIKGIEEIREAHKNGYYIAEIHFHQNGESMLIGLGEMIWRLKYADARIPELNYGFFTNGSLMTEEASEKILDTGIKHIIFSFDAGTKETFEKIRVGLKFEEVYKNILKFAEIKKKKGLKNPVIHTIFVVQKENEDEYDKYMFLFKDKGIDDIGSGGMINYAGWQKGDLRSRFVNYLGDSSVPCWSLWTKFIIGSNGKILLCCYDYEVEQNIGDFREQSIQEIWQGQGFKVYRMAHLRKVFQANGYKNMPLCENCDWIKTWQAPEWWHKEGDEKIC